MASKVSGVIEKINVSGTERAIASSAYGYCETAAAEPAKVVDMTDFKLYEGVTVHVKFKNGNTITNPTLNIQSTGAKPIVFSSTLKDVDGNFGWHSNEILTLTYDGTSWLTTNSAYATSAGYILSGNIKPMYSKTYVTKLYNNPSSGDNYFQTVFNITPDTYDIIWEVKYRLTFTVSGHNDYNAIYDCSMSGRSQTLYSYHCYNSLVTYPIYYHCLYRGSSLSYPHEVGFRIASSYGDTTVQKTVKVDIIEIINCTTSFFEDIKSYRNENITGYARSDINSTSNGLQETGDNDTTGRDYSHSGYSVNGPDFRLAAYTLFGYGQNQKVQGISLYQAGYTSSTTNISTTRVYNTAGFAWEKGLWFTNNWTNYAQNANLDFSPAESFYAVDLRYTDNVYLHKTITSELGIVARKPLYFRGIIGEDGLFYLAPITVTHNNTSYQRVWTQDIPTSNDDYVYWLIGPAYYNDSYAASGYQVNLITENKLYWYHDGRFQEYLPFVKVTTSTDNAIVRFDGTTGQVQNSTATINDNGGLAINSTLAYDNSQLAINNTTSIAAGKSGWAISAASNMAATSNNLVLVGAARSTKNQAYLGFHYEGSGSNSNYLTLGFYGVDHLMKIFPTGQVNITKNITSNSATTGSLVVDGGVGIGGALNVSSNTSLGGTLSVTEATTMSSTLNVSGITTITNTTDYTSGNNAAALSVSGGVHIGKKLNVGTGTTIGGTLSVGNSATIQGVTILEDALIGSQYLYGSALPQTNLTQGRIFFQTSPLEYELPEGGLTGEILVKASNNNRDVMWGDTAPKAIRDADGNTIASTYLKLSGGNITGSLTVGGSVTLQNGVASPLNVKAQNSNNEGGEIVLLHPSTTYAYDIHIDSYNNQLRFYGTGPATKTGVYIDIPNAKLYGAVWNDYAEYRIASTKEPGRVIIEIGNDRLVKSTKRLQPGAEIISDTYGFAIGETSRAQSPVATSGRVLAYPYEDRKEFKKNIGKPVCSGPNGTVSIMTDEEYEKYGYCAIGTISAVPDYDTWGTTHIKVNGRVWIRVK